MAQAVKKNIAIITQARTTSTRLPGKIFREIDHQPLLQYHIDRLVQSGLPVIIATTVNATDDAVEEFAKQHHLPVWRGSEMNVLERFYDCARHFKADIIIRVTSDCPLIDGWLIKKAVEEYNSWNDEAVYYSNGIERTFPRGFDFEIFSFNLLEDAFNHAGEWFQKEHVTPYIHQNRSGKVVIKNFVRTSDASRFRLTVDTNEDLELIEKLIIDFSADKKNAEEIIEIMEAHPELAAMNAHIEQKKITNTQVK